MSKIVAINPGATSTKVGYYTENQIVFEKSISHSLEELKSFKTVSDQLTMRFETIVETLTEAQVDLTGIDGIAARGGLLPPVKAGAIKIDEKMIDYLKFRPRVDHASNLGALIADKLKKECQPSTQAFVYDPVTVDELSEVSRVSGLKGIERSSLGHALNMRSVAIEYAKRNELDYNSSTFIVAHLGGGNTISLHYNGKMIDLLSDDEGPFSTERTGELPIKEVIKLSAVTSEEEMMAKYRKKGGLISYLGTNDVREVERRILNDDKEAILIFNALGYQIAKGIGSLATVASGKIDAIILTGGLAYSQRLMADIKEKISFIGPVFISPGERELLALSEGIQRVLNNEEGYQIFKE